MITMLFAIPLFVLAVVGLALGVILRQRPLPGSCGNCSKCLIRKAGS